MVAIPARYHPELRRHFMPKRFWKNILEVRDEAPGAGVGAGELPPASSAQASSGQRDKLAGAKLANGVDVR